MYVHGSRVNPICHSKITFFYQNFIGVKYKNLNKSFFHLLIFIDEVPTVDYFVRIAQG